MSESSNPLVAARKDTTTPLAGTFLLEDGEALVQAIEEKDWVAGGLAVAGAIGDAAAAASDPIGTLISMGLGWVLDHVQPFNTWLEQLTGDADQVKAHAATWKNVQQHLQTTAQNMISYVQSDVADMAGQTVDAYRGAAGDMAKAINGAGTWAGAMGTALDITAFIVQFVHDFVRDAISEVVGSILSYATELIVSVGLAWPIVLEQITTRIASLIGQVGRNVKNLVTSARNLVKKLGDLKSLFHALKGKLDDLFHNLGHHTDNLSDTGRNTSKTADSTNSTTSSGGTDHPGGSTRPGSGTGTTGGATSTSGGATPTGSGADYTKGTPHPSDGKINNTASAGVTSNSSVGATSPGGPSIRSNENLGSSSLGGSNSTHHPAGDANTHLTDNNVTSPHGSSSHTNSGAGSSSGNSGTGNTGPSSSSTHPDGTSNGSTTPTTDPGHTGGNTNPTSGGANTPTHVDGSHATMTADSAPPTNNNTPHTGNTTTPDGTPGHTTGEPNTPKRALDDDPTTRPTDPVTIEPRHAEEPPQTSGGGDDGNNHGGGGDDGNNHGHVNFDDISTPPSDPTHKYGPSPYENQHVQKWAQETAEATGIPKESILGAYDYTSQSGYSAMNPALRAEASSGTPIPPEVQTRIDNTIAGMDHLDPYSGTTYRGTGVPEDVYTHLSGGKGDYSDPAFMSSSTRPSVAEGFENNLGSDKPVSFEIEGRSGVDISPLSAYGGEAEILFRPGTKFDIIDSHLDKNGILQVKLREKP